MALAGTYYNGKPWQGLTVQIPNEAEKLFLASVQFDLGDGASIKFWRDRWLNGSSVEQLAPNLFKLIIPAAKTMSVAEALQDNKWIAVIRGTPSVQAIMEYLELQDIISTLPISEHRHDTITWRLMANKKYTAKSAYKAFFFGREQAPCAKILWSSGAPLLYKLHMWFTLKNRLWTADRLRKRGLQHPPLCPLCCQEEETAAHLTTQCSFSRQIWHGMLSTVGLQQHTPDVDTMPTEWWPGISSATPPRTRKEVNTLIILTARALWPERNSRVFDRFATISHEVQRKIVEEFELWRKAGLCGTSRGVT